MTDVSVCVITYNHAPFIADALNGILMQQTDFNVKIMIGEDGSSDNTREICKNYATAHPDQIFLLPAAGNLGVKDNFIQTLLACDGKYTAICEGDDCWTDPFKLQKQVNFLETNPAYTLCSTRYRIHDTVTGNVQSDDLENIFKGTGSGLDITAASMFETWLTKTLTVVYRTQLFKPATARRYKYFRDNHLFFDLLKQGKGFCMNFVSGTYNVHSLGIWSGKQELEKMQTSRNIFRELVQKNPDDNILQRSYTNLLDKLINLRIVSQKRPLMNGALYRDIIQYSIYQKAPFFILMKMKTMWHQTFKK